MTIEPIAQGGFNTGRLYIAAGQPIYWAQFADGWLCFKDTARHITGWIDRSDTPAALRAGDVLPGWLMGRYDRNAYELTGPRDADGYRRDPRVPAGFDFGKALRL